MTYQDAYLVTLGLAGYPKARRKELLRVVVVDLLPIRAVNDPSAVFAGVGTARDDAHVLTRRTVGHGDAGEFHARHRRALHAVVHPNRGRRR